MEKTKEEKIQQLKRELKELSIEIGEKKVNNRIQYDNSFEQLKTIEYNVWLQKKYTRLFEVIKGLTEEGLSRKDVGYGYGSSYFCARLECSEVVVRYNRSIYGENFSEQVSKQISETIQKQKEWLFQLNNTTDYEEIRKNIRIRSLENQAINLRNKLKECSEMIDRLSQEKQKLREKIDELKEKYEPEEEQEQEETEED